MKIKNVNARRAISPVIATVILIAITLIAAIAIAGFVFGLFGSFTSTPRVTFVSADISATGATCTMTLENTGSVNATVTGATITYSAASSLALTAPSSPGNVVGADGAPHQLTFTCGTLTGTTGGTYSLTVEFNPGSGSTSYTGTFT